MQYEVTRPSKRLWDRPFVVHALHCAALVRSDCVRHARDCRCSRTKFSVRNRLVTEVWVWLIGSLCRACAVCVGSIAANVLASGTCVWAGQWHKSSASWSRRLTRVDGTVAQNERGLVRCGASHVAVCGMSLGNVPSLADEGGGLAGVDILASEGWGLAGEELRKRGP